jgi:hypothetical protein
VKATWLSPKEGGLVNSVRRSLEALLTYPPPTQPLQRWPSRQGHSSRDRGPP